MKKKYIIMAIVAILFSISACKKDKPVLPDDPIDKVEDPEEEDKPIPPSQPNYVLITSDYGGGNVYLNWAEVDKSRVKEINISYEKDGQAETIEIDDFTESIYVLEGMEVGHKYDFVITAIGMNDEVSEAYNVSITPHGRVVDVVYESIEVSPKGLVLNWSNNSGMAIQVVATVNGEEKRSSFTKAKQGTYIIPINRGEPEYIMSFAVIDEAGNISESRDLPTISNYVEQVAASANWDVTVSSSQPNEGSIAALTDGDVDTYWHSNWWEASKYPYPHWISVDMKENAIVSGVNLFPRKGSNSTFNLFDVEGSVDGVKWEKILKNQKLDPLRKEYQQYLFSQPLELKYIKIVATDGTGWDGSTNLAELQISTYQSK